MSDQPEAAYQPDVEEGQLSQPETGGTEPELVTKADLAELEERLSRVIQSRSDKQESRVQKTLDQWVERLEKRGVLVDDKVRQQLQDRAIQRELAELDEDEPARGVPADVTRIVQDVTAKMRGLEEQYGSLEQEDPEFKMVNFNDPNPERFLFAYEAALSKAASRKASAPEQPLGNPAARTPSPPGSATGNRKEQLLAELTALQNSRDWASQENQARRKQILKELGD